MPSAEHLVAQETDVDVLLGRSDDHLLALAAPQPVGQGELFLWPDLERFVVALGAGEGRGVRDLVVFFLQLTLTFGIVRPVDLLHIIRTKNAPKEAFGQNSILFKETPSLPADEIVAATCEHRTEAADETSVEDFESHAKPFLPVLVAGVDAYEEVTAGAKKKGRKEANQQRCQQVLCCPKGGSAHLMAGQLGAGSSAVAG